MKSIETVANLTADGTLTARIPLFITPGEHQVVIVVEEKTSLTKFKEGLARQVKINAFDLSASKADRKDEIEKALPKRDPLRFSAYQVGLIDDSLTFRREELYDDDI